MNAAAAQHIFVDGFPFDSATVKVWVEMVEIGGVRIDHSNFVTFQVQVVSQLGADSPTTDDDEIHKDISYSIW